MATQQSCGGPPMPIDIGERQFFNYCELQEATNFFNPSRVVGEGGFGKVYKGELTDGRAVAIKELTVRDKESTAQFFNEARVLSRLRHENIVTLYGCTNPDDEKMLLVYEFVPNGTVQDHLHRRRFSEEALTWSQRLQIAIQTAEALSYLHACQPAIIHCDVKTDNILLDNNFNVKVADFGLSRLLPLSRAYISTVGQGTQGYLAPESRQFSKLTTKSDVYSFGVVLMELISSKAFLDYDERNDDEIWLANMAFNKMKNDQLDQIVDLELGYLEDPNIFCMVNYVAQLAYKSLQAAGQMRPPMTDVLKCLKGIRDEASTPIFDEEEIQEATNFFNSSEWVDRCYSGKAYRGKLRDGRDVVIKELSHVNSKKDVEQFFNEIRLISQLCHRNLIALYGCTNLKNEKMLLVHEFMPSETIADHLHRKRFSKKAFTWSQRLHIAIETAEGLAYLHSLQPPIVHYNVKTDNILLDNKFNVKVINFGLCNLRSCWSTTQGYADPEYSEMYGLTTNSDVYSFGVVLLELISGKTVVDVQRHHNEMWLVHMAFSKRKSGRLDELVDPELSYLKDTRIFTMVNSVAHLAFNCLLQGSSRPHMMGVLMKLKVIRDTDTSTSPGTSS